MDKDWEIEPAGKKRKQYQEQELGADGHDRAGKPGCGFGGGFEEESEAVREEFIGRGRDIELQCDNGGCRDDECKQQRKRDDLG